MLRDILNNRACPEWEIHFDLQWRLVSNEGSARARLPLLFMQEYSRILVLSLLFNMPVYCLLDSCYAMVTTLRSRGPQH